MARKNRTRRSKAAASRGAKGKNAASVQNRDARSLAASPLAFMRAATIKSPTRAKSVNVPRRQIVEIELPPAPIIQENKRARSALALKAISEPDNRKSSPKAREQLHCKKRPDSKKAATGKGGGVKRFIPWCG
ncbi:hypothetical protein [Tortoise microvirus 47]|nr:hypothetical protein [Tortoise microvirus 47]